MKSSLGIGEGRTAANRASMVPVDRDGSQLDERIVSLRRVAAKAAAWKWMRGVWVWVLGLLLAFATPPVQAAEFVLDGRTVELGEVSGRTEVLLRSMRFNRVLGVWNAELSVRNADVQPLAGPWVVVAESWTGTPGPLVTDRPGTISAGAPYWNLTAQLGAAALGSGAATAARTITLARTEGQAPQLVFKVYAPVAKPPDVLALAFTRVLDAEGLPLSGARIHERGPTGERDRGAEAESGVVTLGGVVGEHVWRFETPAGTHLPAWLKETLGGAGEVRTVRLLPTPQLTLRSTNAVSIGAGAASVSTADGTVEVRVAAGTFASSGTIRLTGLVPQALPLALPGGWSPATGCWIESSLPFLKPVTAQVNPPMPLPTGLAVAWLRLEESTPMWEVVQVATIAAGTGLTLPCPRPGAYVLATADGAPNPPPAPVVGAVLGGVMGPVVSGTNLTVEARAVPSIRVASTNAALVTARAEIVARTREGTLVSGMRLRCEIMETYRLQDGRIRSLPQHEVFATLFRTAGDTNAGVARAVFPLRPLLLLPGDQLAEATVQVRVLESGDFDGGILLPGGRLDLPGMVLLAPEGVLTSPQAVRWRGLEVTASESVRFELEFGGVTAGRALEFGIQPPLPDGHAVLARSIVVDGAFGLEPVARLRTVAGSTKSLELGASSSLRGLDRPGQYVIVRMAEAPGVVEGLVQKADGGVGAGIPVSVTGQPWLVFTDAAGRYRTVAPVGPGELTAKEVSSLGSGRREFMMPESLSLKLPDLSLGVEPPRVTAITPTHLSTNVPLLTPVVLTFSKSLGDRVPAVEALKLFSADGALVPARVRFDPGATALRLFPSNQLSELARYSIVLSPDLADAAGVRLAGPTTFSFTTLSNTPVQRVGAQLYSEAPGTNGLASVIGTAGLAQPRQPVLFVNDTTGQTATLVANADGSFTNALPAGETDRLRIVLVNTDGSRSEIPVGRQVFPDGSVALFSGGGTFTVQGTNSEIREATVELPPGATLGRTKLKLLLRSLAEAPAVTANTPPADGSPIGLYRLEVEGDPLRVPAKLTFRFDPAVLEAQLAAAPGTNDPILVAAVPRSIEQFTENGPTHVVAYDYLGSLKPVTGGGALAITAGRAARGRAQPQGIIASWILEAGSTGTLDSMLFGVRLWPYFEIIGLTVSAEMGGGVTIVPGTEVPLAGAVVRGRSNSQLNRRPFTLQPGELYATSDQNGVFGMLAPTLYQPGPTGPLLVGYSLVATHPGFPRQFAANSTPNLIDPAHPFGVGRLAFDRKRPPDTVAPSISIVHEPVTPEAGSAALVRMEAADESGPTTDSLDLDSWTPVSASVRFTSVSTGLWRLECDRKAKVILKASSVDGLGNRAERIYAVTFGLPVPRGPLANDPFGPYVSFSQPDENAVGIPTAAAVTLQFSEQIEPDIVSNPATYLTLRPAAGAPRAAFGRDHREVVVSFPETRNDTPYTLTVQNVRDLNGQILDQDPDPASPPGQAFILNFRTAAEVHAELMGIDEGGGVVMRGALAYVLDRKAGKVNTYDLSVPASPAALPPRYLPGPARALALIPDYSYATNFASPGVPAPQPPAQVARGDLLAVAGKLDGGGYLRVFELGNPSRPGSAIGSAVFNLDETSLITRMTWSPPYLVAVENSASAPALRVFSLQETLLGDVYRRLPPDELFNLPKLSTPGMDANHDGDYVDPRDSLPLLGRDAVEFSAGEVDLLTLAPNILANNQHVVTLVDTSRFIADAVVDGASGFVGALVTAGRDVLVELNAGRPVFTNVVQRPASFRGMLVGQSLPEDNRVDFPNWYPKRALLVRQGVLRLAVLNLVALDNSENRIAIVECSRPDGIGLINEIPLPAADFGLVQGAELDGTGRIVFSTVLPSGVENFVLLDIRRLLDRAPAGTVHPAILGIVPGEGASSTPFVARRSGLIVGSLRKQNFVTQTSPLIRLVPADEGWTDPFTAGDLDERVEEFRRLPELELLPVAFHGTNSTLVPGDTAVHFQLMAELPGGAGREISLAALSLDGRGRLVERTNNAQPPAFLADLSLRRLSDEPWREGFNVYLSRPIALLAQDLDSATSGSAQSAHARHLLFAGDRFRVGIPESMTSDPVLGPFAGSGDVSRAGDTNRPALRLGVSLVRPVFNLRPQLEAEDALKISTSIDWVNTNACPGHVTLHFSHNLDCRLTLTIDGRPVRGVNDDLGNLIADVTDVPSVAGAHWFLLDAAHVGAPGTHRFELVAHQFEGLPPGVRLTEVGTIEHEIEIHHSFPIGHTIVQGVDIWDGHLTHSAQDVAIPGRRLNLEFARTYSSSGSSTAGPLGPGWTHNYNIRLVRDDCGKWTVIGGDGSGNAFRNPQPNPAQAALYAPLLPAVSAGGRYEFFQPQIGFHSTLVRDTDKPAEVWFFTKSAVRYGFVVEGKLSTPQNTVFTLREIREPNGNALRFDYLDNDFNPTTLDTVTEIDPLGSLPKRGFRFSYRTIASEERIVELTGFNHQGSPDLLGLRLSFDYDADGNLAGCTRMEPDGSRRHMGYGYTTGVSGPYAHNLLSTTNANGNVVRYEYYPSGVAGYFAAGQPMDGVPSHEVIRSITLVGAAQGVFEATADAVTRFIYDWAGFTRKVSDPRGVDSFGAAIPDTEYTLNLYGATTRIAGPLGHVTEMRWATDHLDGSVTDGAGNPVHDILMTSKTDAEGQEHRYAFHDGRGNLTTERIVPAPGKAAVLNAAGVAVAEVVSTTVYNRLFNAPIHRVDPEGNGTVIEIDPLTGNTAKVTDAEGFVTRFFYQPNGALRERIDPRGYRTTYNRYDIYGNAEVVRSEVERGGRVLETVHIFDERSRLTDTQDTFGHHRTTEYDGLDRPFRTHQLNDRSRFPGLAGANTETGYHPGGEVAYTVNPLGLVTRQVYDALGRRVRSEQLAVRQPGGPPSDYRTRASYDTAGNVVSETDARDVVRTHRFDALNRRVLTEISGPFGPNQVLSRAAYDRVGNVTNSVDLHGFTTSYELDGLYRVVATRLPVAGAVVRATFDQVGTTRSSTDALGNRTVYEYDRLYRTKAATDPEGNVSRYTYDEAGNRRTETKQTSGLVVTLEYDGLNRVVSQTQEGPGIPAPGYVTTTDYRDASNETAVTNARGFRNVTRKDGLDRPAWTIADEAGLGLRTEFTYDAAGNVLTLQDPENGDIDIANEYDPLGRRMRSTYAGTPDDGGAPVYEETRYDGAGNVLATRDRRGLERRFAFDNHGRSRTSELREDLSNGGAWLTISETEYDDAANAVVQYDANRNRLETRRDALGRPAELIDAAGQASHATYDAINRRSETDRRGLRSEFTYDRLNRLRTTTEFDTNNAAITRTETIYRDAARQLVAIDRRGLSNITHFDALGRIVRTERSGGDTAARYGSDPLRLETRQYDANNNLVLVTDARGNQVKHDYDGVDRVAALIEGFGSPVEATTRFVYDKAGNLRELKDARVHGGTFDVQHSYDARYRRTNSVNALGQGTAYHYDAANNRVELIEPVGGSTRYEYDELNTLLSVDESARNSGTGDAGVTRFRYDANRNRLAQQDAVGNLVTYAYDQLNRQTQMVQHLVMPPPINPRGHAPVPAPGVNLAWAYNYDPDGNQVFIRDPRGQEVRLGYDHLSRLVARAYTNHAEKTAAGLPRDFQVLYLAFAYDGNGNRTNAVETKQLGAGVITETTTAEYDALNRLAVKTRFDFDDPMGRRLAFAYDGVGNRTSVTDPDLRVTTYAFDARNRLQKAILDPGAAQLEATYEWESDNLLRHLTLPGGAFSDRVYDPADRVVGITNGGPAAALFSAYRYGYDANGNRTNQIEWLPAVSVVPESSSYRYDAMNRVTNIVYAAPGTMSYTYAANGNRLTERGVDPVGGGVVNRVFSYAAVPGRLATTFNGVNTLTRIEDLTPAASHVDYEYDANLNQIARIQGGVTNRFRFDIRDQMIAAETAAGVVRFDYNADRLRAKKVSSLDPPPAFPETRYLYDQEAVLVEYGGAAMGHGTQHKYDYGDRLLALGTPPPAGGGALGRDFYLQDGLGSTANLVSSAGAHTKSYRYDAWGRMRAESGTSGNLRQYTGHYRDPETGLHYFGARYYDDEQARFLSQDPYLGEAGTPPSLHRYLYAYANPLRYVDLGGYEGVPSNPESPPKADAKKDASPKKQFDAKARTPSKGKPKKSPPQKGTETEKLPWGDGAKESYLIIEADKEAARRKLEDVRKELLEQSASADEADADTPKKTTYFEEEFDEAEKLFAKKRTAYAEAAHLEYLANLAKREGDYAGYTEYMDEREKVIREARLEEWKPALVVLGGTAIVAVAPEVLMLEVPAALTQSVLTAATIEAGTQMYQASQGKLSKFNWGSYGFAVGAAPLGQKMGGLAAKFFPTAGLKFLSMEGFKQFSKQQVFMSVGFGVPMTALNSVAAELGGGYVDPEAAALDWAAGSLQGAIVYGPILMKYGPNHPAFTIGAQVVGKFVSIGRKLVTGAAVQDRPSNQPDHKESSNP